MRLTISLNRTRYFLGDDSVEYRWKCVKGVGLIVRSTCFRGRRSCPDLVQSYQLTCCDTNEEVARFAIKIIDEGCYVQEKKPVLVVQPCSVDVDLVILSWVIMENKLREGGKDGSKFTARDEDPVDGGGAGDSGPGEL